MTGLPQLGSILRDEYQKTRLLFIIDGVLINAALVLTSGIFLSGYIVYLGGSDFLVGLMNNSLTWASIVSVLSFLVFERMERRKKLLLILLVASRVTVCSIIFLPLLFGKGSPTLELLTVMVIVGNVMWGAFGIGSSVWMMGSFPKEVRNEFVYKRVFWLRISFTIATVAMGFILDWTGKSYAGFLVVFLTSLVLSLGDAVTLLNVKETGMAIDRNSGFNPRMFFEPIAQKDYRNFLAFIFLYYLSLSISSSYTPLYLIRYMKFDYRFISVVNVIAYVFMIVFTKFWGRLDGKKGLMFVFKASGLVAIVEFLIYGFLQNKTYFILYLAPVFAGIGNSGFNVSVFTYRYELMPESNRTIYEGWYGAVIGLSLLISPAIGDFMMNSLPTVNNGVFQYSRFQFMYIISFSLAAAVLLLMLKSHRGRKGAYSKDRTYSG